MGDWGLGVGSGAKMLQLETLSKLVTDSFSGS